MFLLLKRNERKRGGKRGRKRKREKIMSLTQGQ
jgi:hypothetical protein